MHSVFGEYGCVTFVVTTMLAFNETLSAANR